MLRGKKVKLNSSKVETPVLDMRIHNKFSIEVIDAKTGSIKQKASALNIILDNLWERLCAWQQYADYIHYGSGSGTPSTSDTGLFVNDGYAKAEVIAREIDYSNGVYSVQRKIQLSEIIANGVSISEVGVGYSTSPESLCTHAMLMDMNGNPISITKTDTDIINIYSTIYVHFNKYGYDNGSIQLYKASSNGYNILDALAGSNACRRDSSSTYGDTYGYVYNQGGYAVKYDSSSYRTAIKVTHSGDYNNKEMTLTMERIPVASCNVGGFQCIDFDQHYTSYGTSYSARFGLCVRSGGSWFPYSQITGDAIGTGDGSKIKFNLNFQYAKNVEVFVDGVKTTNFSVRYGVTDKDNFKYYMEPLRDESTKDNFIYNYSASSSFTKFIFYNPMHAIGISSIDISNGSIKISCSNDLISWSSIAGGTVPTAFQHYKFWKLESTNSVYYSYLNITPCAEADSCVIFANPPAEGAVITANYLSDSIAKDIYHVFDLNITLHLSEYVE